MQPAIIVHGGAGNDFDDRLAEFRPGVERAARAGWAALRDGRSALDAVEAAVRVLEDDPTFDAGHGSFLNRKNEVEMDAMIMSGATLNNGAVAGIQRVANPVQVARLVMEHTQHSLVVGLGAEEFARSEGVPVCPMEELVAGSSTYRLKPEDRVFNPDAAGDTVGAIALDVQGNLAVATSTGGTAGKLPGRVGDTPLVGSGGYADNLLGAAAATGHGEALMKILFSKTACDLLGAGLSPQQAAGAALEVLQRRTGKTQGGIILMSPRGEVGAAYNTHHMVHAWFDKNGLFQMRD
jgi:beta-aspartyl-peptidase (threonine type)